MKSQSLRFVVQCDSGLSYVAIKTHTEASRLDLMRRAAKQLLCKVAEVAAPAIDRFLYYSDTNTTQVDVRPQVATYRVPFVVNRRRRGPAV